jgi:twitching motility protein PilI
MPNKDALRNLQLRLASRLQAARERPREAGWLAVECASAGLLLPLGQSGEIHPAKGVTPVPRSVPWLAGIANVRGQLNAVLDLAVFLGLRESQPVLVGQRVSAQLVVLNPSLRVNCAIMIDRLAGLRGADQLTAVPNTDTNRPGFARNQWQDEAGRVWDELDLMALVSDPLFLDVAT